MMTIFRCHCGEWHDSSTHGVACPVALATFAIAEKPPGSVRPIWTTAMDRYLLCLAIRERPATHDGHVVEVRDTRRLVIRAYRRACPTCDAAAESVSMADAPARYLANPETTSPCVCCGAPHVKGAALPNWCDDCNACDPEGVWSGDVGPTFAHSCPRVQSGEVQASR